MCGIVGYAGSKQALPILEKGLSLLEYRGYDSAGVAIMGQALHLVKRSGPLENLRAALQEHSLSGCVGIGHTRWATHGEPSEQNAHPQTDAARRIAVVHNGIIENYLSLREELEKKGVRFLSQTDTEVIAHLLAELYRGDMPGALSQVQQLLRGSYALAVVCREEPNALYCMRRESPLIIGLGDDGQFLASDIQALLPFTQQIDVLENGEIACLERGGVRIFDASGRERRPRPRPVQGKREQAAKGAYAHYMLKEIHEQPDALARTLRLYADPAMHRLRHGAFPVSDSEANTASGMIIAACGTAWHAAMVGRYGIERLAGLPVNAEIASEFRYRPPLHGKDTLFLAISQSGETADTLAALRAAAAQTRACYALTNVPESTLAREVGEKTLYTAAGPEISVASTKAFITQMEVLLLLALDLGVKRGKLSSATAETLLQKLFAVPGLARRTLEAVEPRVKRFAAQRQQDRCVFFIGRGADYAVALEASLKLKEVSYIHSEAYPAGELKHGTISLIEPGTLVCALITQPDLAAKTLSNVQEVKARGASVLVICTESLRGDCQSDADELWAVPDTDPTLTPLLSVIPVQLLAYYMALFRGRDVDKPRNLAKSVTVE